ncbi:unnamed protein product, partial [Didymodactylos carnosus]
MMAVWAAYLMALLNRLL